MVFGNNVGIAVRDAWYHGFTWHATPGSRAQITTVLKPGFFLCLDPEAYADDSTYQAAGTGSSNLKTGADYGLMSLHPEPYAAGQGDNQVRKLARAVTRPFTITPSATYFNDALGLPFGVIVDVINPRVWGAQSLGAGPHMVRCAVAGEGVQARLNGTFRYGDPIVLSDGSFYGVPLVQVASSYAGVANTGQIVTGTDAAILANLRLGLRVVGYCLQAGTFDGSTLTPIRLCAPWCPVD